jgi:hypothetical protein
MSKEVAIAYKSKKYKIFIFELIRLDAPLKINFEILLFKTERGGSFLGFCKKSRVFKKINF